MLQLPFQLCLRSLNPASVPSLDSPRSAAGTQVTVDNLFGSSDSVNSHQYGPSFAVGYQLPSTGVTQVTRPLPYLGRNTPPTAQVVEDALNDLPALQALNRPLSVSSTAAAVQVLMLDPANSSFTLGVARFA